MTDENEMELVERLKTADIRTMLHYGVPQDGFFMLPDVGHLKFSAQFDVDIDITRDAVGKDIL